MESEELERIQLQQRNQDHVSDSRGDTGKENMQMDLGRLPQIPSRIICHDLENKRN